MERTRINAEGKELFASLYAVENILKVYEEKYHRLVDRIPSITVCKRLFPSVKLLPTDRCKRRATAWQKHF